VSPTLVVPTAALHMTWLQARDELEPGAHIDGSGLLEHDDVETPAGFAAWTERLRHCADPAVAPAPGRVHSTYRWIVEHDTYLGTIDLRHGYSIRPSARRRGLATWALARTLERAHTMGLDRVLLTCDADNAASAATIKSNGGQLEDTRETILGLKQRYWIDYRGAVSSV
jgi:predicted acetyltransferase